MTKEQFLSASLPFKLVILVKSTAHSENGYLEKLNDLNLSKYINSELDKPVLNPLSDYEKLNLDISDELMIEDILSKRIHYGFMRFSLIYRLIEERFDFLGLIEKGEAVDVNTVPDFSYY